MSAPCSIWPITIRLDVCTTIIDRAKPSKWAALNLYPRKNWSSLMLFNCGHTANAVLTPALVNYESGAFLHRLQWLNDDVIGAMPETWNWLEGWSPKPAEGTPKAVHYTRGGPWFENWRDVDYADLWQREAAELDRD